MKTIYRLIACILLFTSFTSLAQNKINVTGTVIDAEDSFPLEYATISFVDAATGNVAEGGITDPKGQFSIEVVPGTYNVKIEYLSYKTKTYNNKVLDNDIDLGTVGLSLNLGP